jgi:hypothetical protein
MTLNSIQHRARNYPYDRPEYSFFFDKGEITELREGGDECFRDRHPVLAFGSNAAPEQLQRKYSEAQAVDASFAVTRATLQDFDVVYSAHLTSYGAVPATLAPSPGTSLETWVTWLDDDQLVHMHSTEMGAGGGADVNYAYGHLQDVVIEIDFFGDCSSVGVYLSNYGALALSEAPLAFERIAAANRVFEARDKLSVLENVRQLLAPDHSLDGFIHEVVHNPESRSRWGGVLKPMAHTLDFPGFVQLLP